MNFLKNKIIAIPMKLIIIFSVVCLVITATDTWGAILEVVKEWIGFSVVVGIIVFASYGIYKFTQKYGKDEKKDN